jgi:hypothetical protein
MNVSGMTWMVNDDVDSSYRDIRLTLIALTRILLYNKKCRLWIGRDVW